MKKSLLNLLILLICLSFTSLISIDAREFGNNIDYIGHSEKVDVDALQEISKKYGAIEQELTTEDDYERTAPQDYPTGSIEYVNYQNNDYTRTTSFTRNNYFSNLNDYSSYNSMGSCGYVSLIQAMSYYDTFYNDNIIPEVFEDKFSGALTEAEAKADSPGVVRQYYNSSIFPTYFQFCHATEQTDLQSRLTVIQNVLNNTDNETRFSPSIGGWSYQRLLNNFYDNSNISVVVNRYENKTQSEYINIIKDVIGSGNPIVVHIKKYNSDGVEVGYHSVVAFDYDETGIYANFGWSDYYTRVQLLGSPAGYSKITEAYTLDYSANGHQHSDNYIINGKGYCGCNISDELHFKVPGNWTNVPPTFYWMKDLYDSEQTYTISFRSSYNGTNIKTYTTSKNQITLSIADWNAIVSQSYTSRIYVYFKRNSSLVNYNSHVFVIDKPTNAIEYIYLTPAEYGFEQRYYFENEGIRTKTIAQGAYNIYTSRLRCGYIEKEYIVLSARRAGAGTAYLTYSFDNYVYRINVDLTMWSSSESISKNDATAYLQYKKANGQWVTIMDLLNDITLSTDRTNPNTYSIVFPEGIKEFRFYTTANSIGDRNKGRICIGDMKIYLE